MDTLNAVGEALVGSSWAGPGRSSVIVRQVPLQEMLSPSLASDKIRGQEVMVSEVPFPPVDVESRERRVEIAGVKLESGFLDRGVWVVFVGLLAYFPSPR